VSDKITRMMWLFSLLFTTFGAIISWAGRAGYFNGASAPASAPATAAAPTAAAA